MVNEDGDAAVGVETEEPVFLLLVGHDVTGEGTRVSLSKGLDVGRQYSGMGRTYMRVCVHSVP